jgi:helicase
MLVSVEGFLADRQGFAEKLEKGLLTSRHIGCLLWEGSTMDDFKERIIGEFLEKHGYDSLNFTQESSIEAGILESDDSYIIIAPTAAGKTGVAELVVRSSLESEPKERVLYVAPLASLVKAKLEEFGETLSEYEVMKVGKSGWSEHGEIVVGSNESVYNTFLLSPDSIKSFSVLILDELHLLYQMGRGHVVEKLLTLAKLYGIRLVCLSATVEDKNELAEWLGANCVAVPDSERPIPLTPYDIPQEDFERNICSFGKHPTLVFCATRNWTESRALKLAEFIESNGLADSYPSISDIKGDLEGLSNIGLTEKMVKLASSISNGVAWYHSGLPPNVREYIENMYSGGEIDFLFSTTALAFGFDSPTRTVVIYDIRRFNPSTRGQEGIGVHEFRQMAGRAGRPSKSEFNDGYVCGIIKDATTIDDLERYRTDPLEKVASHVGTVDDYFEKAIMELIYSGKDSEQEIVEFFSHTLYTFEPEGDSTDDDLYSISNDVKHHLKELERMGFLRPLPRNKFTLTDFGEFVIKFELNPYVSYDLSVYSMMKGYLETSFQPGDTLPLSISVFYRIAKILDIGLGRKRGATLEDHVLDEYSSEGWSVADKCARTAVVIRYGWLEGLSAPSIERVYGVYAENLESVARTLAENGFHVLSSIARILGVVPDLQYETIAERLKYGISEELLPLVRIRQVGRMRALSIVASCDAMVINLAMSTAYREQPDGTPLIRNGQVLARKGDRITPRGWTGGMLVLVRSRGWSIL